MYYLQFLIYLDIGGTCLEFQNVGSTGNREFLLSLREDLNENCLFVLPCLRQLKHKNKVTLSREEGGLKGKSRSNSLEAFQRNL